VIEIVESAPRDWASGMGLPVAAFPSPSGATFAVVGELRSLYWPGRALSTGHPSVHRIAIHRTTDRGRLATLDVGRWPVQDVAFHPTLPLLAIATGSYDGGWSFEGELLVWNLGTGEVKRPMRDSRDVARCRFEGDRIVVLLRPTDESSVPDGVDPFSTYERVSISNWEATGTFRVQATGSMTDVGFEQDRTVETGPALASRLAGHAARGRIVDVAWRGDDRVAVDVSGQLDVWSAAGDSTWGVPSSQVTTEIALESATGGAIVRAPRAPRAAQLLPSPSRLLLHVIDGEPDDRSSLYEVAADGPTLVRRFDYVHSFSRDGAGRMLARRCNATDRDLLLDESARTIGEVDLGPFDCFNHSLRVDDAGSLYALAGSPPEAHRRKRLVSVGARGTVDDVMAWDDGDGPHLMEGSAVVLDSGDVVVGYRVYDPKPSVRRCGLERRARPTGAPVWKVELPCPPAAMVVVGASVVVSTLSGRLMTVDVTTGKVTADVRVVVDGVPASICAMAVRGNAVLAGTLDGRVLDLRA
jgi:hypothetical protein